MNVMNLLANVEYTMLGETFDVSLNWIGKFVKILISSGLGVGLGVILFSLVLKFIVLPFDVFQRISMRKQNIKMKENKDKLEKLQKQYANDKQMYNQKVMELQKQSGFSMLSACLPMILSMVIFIVAIGAFNAYAKFSAVDNYNTLVNAYDDKVKEYVVDVNAEDNTYTLTNLGTNDYYIVVEADTEANANKVIDVYAKVSAEKAATLATADAATLKTEAINATTYRYFINTEKAQNNEEIIAAGVDCTNDQQLIDFFNNKGAEEAKNTYDTEIYKKTKFLWIKNIWATDASYKHPVLSHEDFLSDMASSSCGSCGTNGQFIDEATDEEMTLEEDGSLRNKDGLEMTTVYKQDAYERVTKNLSVEKEQANGYYILIVLSIGTILLQQFIMMRSQKEQQQFSSVDGQAASTQKMTMIVMTVMFGFFSFMYSAAFSIYMTMSNLFSMGSTLLINKLVDVAAHKKEQKALQEKYNRRLPRNQQNGKNNKNNKK